MESKLDPKKNILSSLTVSDPWDLCPSVNQFNWRNVELTLDNDGKISSYVGP